MYHGIVCWRNKNVIASTMRALHYCFLLKYLLSCIKNSSPKSSCFHRNGNNISVENGYICVYCIGILCYTRISNYFGTTQTHTYTPHNNVAFGIWSDPLCVVCCKIFLYTFAFYCFAFVRFDFVFYVVLIVHV